MKMYFVPFEIGESFEPILNDEDRRIWNIWKYVCLLHAQTIGYHSRIQCAKERIFEMHMRHPDAYFAWSAGKDSTAMVHLASTVLGGLRAMSIKDDCDFPGEEMYVRRLAGKWNVKLDVIKPRFSVQERLAELELSPGDDIHARASDLSDQAFYSLVEEYRQSRGMPGVYLGIRKAESYARLMNRAKRGHIYTKRDGETVCMPICDWSDKDVYAYLFSNDIELLALYCCVRLAESPAKVRKSWWVPGSSARYGQTVWLKTYYPSIFNRYCQLVGGASIMA